MVFPILGGNSAVGGYSIDNSLRFNDNDSAYLGTTFASAGNTKTWTFSTWFKRGNLSTNQRLFSGGNFGMIGFDSTDDRLTIRDEDNNPEVETSQVFRDVGAWYHIVVASDTTQVTSSNRVKIYVNGNLITDLNVTNYPSQNYDWKINSNANHFIGAQTRNGPNSYFDGYMSEVNFIDGQQLDASSFGEFDESGLWKPISYSGSYGTNGFYLDFENSGSLGTDQSGNGNNFTPTNLASTDQTTDTPTNNFATILPMANTSLSEGNLKLTTSRTGYWDGTIGNFGVKSGKWYHEVRMSYTEATFRCVAGWIGNEASQTVVLNGKGITSDPYSSLFDNYAFLSWAGNYYKDGTYHGTSPTASSGDIINIAVDFDNGKIWFGVNGTYYNNSGSATGDPSAGTNESISGIDLTASEYVPFFQIRSDSSIGGNIMIPNFGQDGSFAGTETAQGNSDGNGQGDFYYSVPTGFLALNSSNLATALSPTIDDGSAYFHTQLYTGTGSTNAVTNDANAGDFQPDWLWIKNRSATSNHYIIDSNRGDFVLYSNLSNSEDSAGYFESFDSDGFTVSGNTANANASGNNFTAWQWKANGGTTSSNTDGSITATLQSNATSGFAIATWSGTGTAGTIGHNLGVAPKLVIVKRRNSPANSWLVQHSDLASNFVTFLNRGDTGGETDSSVFNGTYPTSSVFSVGTHAGTNQSGGTYVGYIFAPITGYSAMGTYTGNGSTNGTFVYTGFRPAWVLAKRYDSTGNWVMHDNKRNGFNVDNDMLIANLSNAESDVVNLDLLSNGFKWRNSSTGNQSGANWIYMAFAESPFVSSSGVPVVAR